MIKSAIYSLNAPKPIGPYSQAVRASGELVFVSSQIPLKSDGILVEGDIQAQVSQVMDNIGKILIEAGCSFDNIVKTTVFLKNLKDFASMNDVYETYFPDIKPARSVTEISDLPKGALIAIEAIAII